jgi:D-glycero-D-manno-heptose 1,7-bisphosphate phosphatase
MLKAMLFDRDGTLVVDVPYNGNPERVVPMEDARACLDRLRDAGLKLGVVTNQSGIGRGLITREQMGAVHARIESLLGPFDGWFVCTHAPEESCDCRKPKPKLLFDAARTFGVDVGECIFVGDKDDDAEAARAAGMRMLRVGPNRPLARACEEVLSRLASL